jgi:hypothetical protein
MLRGMLARGKAAGRKLVHVRILLKADASPGRPAWHDLTIAEALEVGRATVERVRRQFVEEGRPAALERRKRRRQYTQVLDGDGEAYLVALACGQAPDGHGRWTLRLLAQRMVQWDYGRLGVERYGDPRSQKNEPKAWMSWQSCSPHKAKTEFVWKMEKVLEMLRRPDGLHGRD